MAARVSRRRALIFAATALAALAPASFVRAGSLNVANVNSPAINCVFNTSCRVTVSDKIASIPLAGTTQTGRLQSRTYTGAHPAPAGSRFAYVYRVDLRQATGPTPCVTAVRIPFGLIFPLQYDGAGPLDHVFVITSGGVGSIGLASASQADALVTFTFASPVCAGQSSFFFGLTSDWQPKTTGAWVYTTPGMEIVLVSPVSRPNYVGNYTPR